MELIPFGLNQKSIQPQSEEFKPLKESRVEWGEYGVLAGSIIMAVGAILGAVYTLHPNNYYLCVTYNLNTMAKATLIPITIGCGISAASSLIIFMNTNKIREECEKATTQTELATTLKRGSLLAKELTHTRGLDNGTRITYFAIASLMAVGALFLIFWMSLSHGYFDLPNSELNTFQIFAKGILYSTIPFTIAMAVNAYYLVSKQKQRHQKLTDAEIQQLLSREVKRREEAHNQAHQSIIELHSL